MKKISFYFGKDPPTAPPTFLGIKIVLLHTEGIPEKNFEGSCYIYRFLKNMPLCDMTCIHAIRIERRFLTQIDPCVQLIYHPT